MGGRAGSGGAHDKNCNSPGLHKSDYLDKIGGAGAGGSLICWLAPARSEADDLLIYIVHFLSFCLVAYLKSLPRPRPRFAHKQ